MVRNIVMPLYMDVYLSDVFNTSLEAKPYHILPSSSLCPLILCIVPVFYSCLSLLCLLSLVALALTNTGSPALLS